MPSNKQIIILFCVALFATTMIYLVVTIDFTPKYITQCTQFENRTFYTSPTYVCVMYGEYGCQMQMPVGGGVPYIKEVCIADVQVLNPKYRGD